MDVFDLFAKISLDTSGFEQGLNNAKSNLKSFSENISGMGGLLKTAVDGFKAVESVGKTAGTAVMTGLKGFAAASAAVAGFGTTAVKTGANFDQAMSQVSATLGLTVSDIKNNVNGAGDTFTMLRNKALEMGSATNFTSKEAAEGLNILAMSGYDAYSSVSMIEDVLHLAAAGSMDMANAAGYVSGAMKGFNDETKDSGYYADLMAKGATLANTSVAQLGEALSDGAATAKTYGQSAETTTLALLRLAEQGEIGSAASTALAAAMKNLYAPTNQAKKVMQELGVNAFDPTTGTARDFNVVVNELQGALSGYSDEQRTAYAQTIFGIQGFAAYNKMVVTSTEKQKEWADALSKATGEAAKQYETMTDNLIGDLDRLGSAFEGLQIVISDALTLMVRDFAKFGADAMNALREGFQGGGVSGFMSALSKIVTDGVTMLAKKAPEFASVTLQFVEAMATGLLNAGPQVVEAAREIIFMLVETVPTFLADHAQQIAEIGTDLIREISVGFTEGIYHLRGAIGELIPMIVDAFLSYHEALFTAGLAILSEIGQGIVENQEEIQSIASSTIEHMVKALSFNAPMIIDGGIALLEALVGAIQENLTLIAETAVDIIAGLATGIGEAAPDLIPAAVEAVLTFIEGLTNPESLNELIGAALKLIEGLGEGIIKAIPMLIAYGPEIVVNLVTGIISALPQLVEVGAQLIMGLIEGLVQGIIAIPEAIARVVSAIVDGFKALFGIHSPSTVMAEMGVNLIEGLLQGISDAWKSIVEFFSEAAENLINFLGETWDSIKKAASEAWENIKETVSSAWDAIQDVWNAAGEFFGGLWDDVKTAGSEAVEAVQKAFDDAWNAITKVWDGAVSFFGGIWGDIKGAFGDAVDAFSSIGGNIVDGIKSGISNAWKGLTGWVSGLFKDLVNSVKSMLGIASPSKVFAGIGGNMALGLEKGWNDEYADIKRQIEDGLDFGPKPFGPITAGTYNTARNGYSSAETAQNLTGNTTVNIYSPVAVDAVQAAREWKKTTQRMAMSYV